MSKSIASKKNKSLSHVTHPFAPVYSPTSKVLILGTIPSPSSRKNEFYYMHPQNRFWQVIQKIFDVEFKFKKVLFVIYKLISNINIKKVKNAISTFLSLLRSKCKSSL